MCLQEIGLVLCYCKTHYIRTKSQHNCPLPFPSWLRQFAYPVLTVTLNKATATVRGYTEYRQLFTFWQVLQRMQSSHLLKEQLSVAYAKDLHPSPPPSFSSISRSAIPLNKL